MSNRRLVPSIIDINNNLYNEQFYYAQSTNLISTRQILHRSVPLNDCVGRHEVKLPSSYRDVYSIELKSIVIEDELLVDQWPILTIRSKKLSPNVEDVSSCYCPIPDLFGTIIVRNCDVIVSGGNKKYIMWNAGANTPTLIRRFIPKIEKMDSFDFSVDFITANEYALLFPFKGTIITTWEIAALQM